ncbi:MAG: S8 family serine peptidase, partial [Acidobacteriota bacterium]|nr:S8 family serine peptidase [Acidobacteriota bacterium]
MVNASRTAVVLAVMLLALPLLVLAGDAPEHVPGRIVVKLAPDEAARAGAGRVPSFLSTRGVTSLRPMLTPGRRPLRALEARFGLDRIFVAELPEHVDVESLARIIESEPGAEFAHADYIGQGGVVPVVADDTAFSIQWNLDNTGQSGGTVDADMDVTEAWRTATGRRETVVAVLDSGVDGDHSQFRGRIARGGKDEVNTDLDPEGDHSHGTSVSGITLAIANDQFSVAGIDWRAAQLPIKILNSMNSGSTTDLMDGINYAANQGADVSNMSLINYPNTGGLANAIAFADAAGVIQIGCNGNGGSSVLNYPASYPEVLSTGWTDRNDVRSGSSNFTTTLDVMAPGVSVQTVPYGSSSDTSAAFSGCSAATPNAAGVASVLLAMDPTLTFVQVRDILRSTADDEVGPPTEDVPGRDDFYGWGRINMERALNSLGLVSDDVIHVDGIVLEEGSANRLHIRVAVVDDLTGAEESVQVDGTLTLPNLSTVPLSGTTGSNGIVSLSYQPGGQLPSGTFAFTVDDVSKAGFVYDASANFETTRSHDPDLDGLHVGAIEMTDDFDTVTIEVLVLDDDGI